MNFINKSILLLRNKGLRYILFRSKYEFERRISLLSRKFPISPKKVSLLSLDEWRKGDINFFFKSKEELSFQRNPDENLKNSATRIFNGEINFFSSQWYNLGKSYDWITNPVTQYRYDIKKHWTKIEDLSNEAGDIKFVWEKSRFTYLYTIIRYDYHFAEDHSEFVISQILDWIEKNPLNCGPNYKCSQEISLRVLNWIFALNFYKNSQALAEDRWQKIINSIYWQIDHVYNNINFSRIAVRNNHAITETLTLYLVGLLFPQFPFAQRWKKKGKQWFEEEIDYQIADDGTFIQNSMNYHRVVIQLLTWAISLSNKNDEKFSDFIYEKAHKSINFLYQCQEISSGWLPNYGANDGALFFPMSSNDYRDYRPQLDALNNLLSTSQLYDDKYEDSCWIDAMISSKRKCFPQLKQQQGLISFQKSGYYLIREEHTLTFIRCGLFNGMGGCRDELHVDVWHNGENVLIDCGSYKYNTDLDTVRYFSGTESHNTIMLGEYDQMLKGPRFVWFYPPQIKNAELSEQGDFFVFKGRVACFSYLGKNIEHERIIYKKKNAPIWKVEDVIVNKPYDLKIRQLWHTVSPERINFQCVSHAEEKQTVKFHSSYYGIREVCTQVEFVSTESTITTNILIN